MKTSAMREWVHAWLGHFEPVYLKLLQLLNSVPEAITTLLISYTST